MRQDPAHPASGDRPAGWWLPVALAALFGAAGWCGGQLMDLQKNEADHNARLRSIEGALDRIEKRLDTLQR